VCLFAAQKQNMCDSLAFLHILPCQFCLERHCLALPMCLPSVCLEVASGALVQWLMGVYALLARLHVSAHYVQARTNLFLTSTLQVLTLFLTLDISATSSHRLAQHPEWKQALNDEPLFRSFQLARNLPTPNRETMPSACAPAAPVTSIASLGLGLLKGVQILGRKVHSSISATPMQESTGDPAVDAVLSQVAGISERATK
jgi:hypothetical protein